MARSRPRTAPTLLLAAAGGAALVASFPPGGWPPLAVLAWAPLYHALVVAPAPPRLRALCGVVVGLWVGLAGASWMYGTLVRFAGLAPLAAALGHLAFALYVSVPFVVAALGWGTLRALPFPVRAAGAGVWLAAVEAALPTAVGYRSVVGLAAAPVWIQLADVGGVAWVTAGAVACGALAAEIAGALRDRAWRRAATAGALLGGIACGAALYGSVRMEAVDRRTATADTVPVGIVQPSFAPRDDDRAGQIRRLRAGSDRLAADGARIVIWPESSYPWAITLPWRPPVDGPKTPYGTRPRPLVLATTTYVEDDPYPNNRAFALTADGRVSGSYAKVHLLPFGERVPWIDPAWAEAHLPGVQHYRAGMGPGVFEIDAGDGPLRLAPLICYEDTLPRHGAEAAALGIDAFVNLTNDAWFGPTAAPWQHEALAVFRAVEQRRPMLRAVGTGPSALVDAAGRVVRRTGVTWRADGGDLEVLLVDVPRLAPRARRERTFFGRFAPAVEGSLVVLALLLSAAGLVASRRPARGAGPAGAGTPPAPHGDRPGS